MKNLLDSYVKGFIVQVQTLRSPFSGAIPSMVCCRGCNGGENVVGSSYKDICDPCQGTGRVPIPWAEVMNVRQG